MGMAITLAACVILSFVAGMYFGAWVGYRRRSAKDFDEYTGGTIR